MDLMKNVVLSAVNLHKSYAGKLALKDVSIELREGEFVALLGPKRCWQVNTHANTNGTV